MQSFLNASLVLLVITPTTAWIALALYYHPRSRWIGLAWACLPISAICTCLMLLPLLPWVVAIWFSMFAFTLLWWRFQRPTGNRDWAVGMAVLPRVDIDGDRIRIHNFRNFDYDTNGVPLPRYEERTFDLSKLESVDYFLCRLSGPLIAHTLVSFGFQDDQFLAVSVEARRDQGQAYSPFRGLFHAYELMFVLGDEYDIIRLRTNVHQESVKMYRVQLAPQYKRQLLLDYFEQANTLLDRRQWYNSLLSNCTTNLFYHRNRHVQGWFKLGVFVNGLSARTLFHLGLLGKNTSFRDLAARSEIRELGLAAVNASDFSRRIRTRIVQLPDWQVSR